ncbi:unnamed protein product, partial [Strongylus vulgaris]
MEGYLGETKKDVKKACEVQHRTSSKLAKLCGNAMSQIISLSNACEVDVTEQLTAQIHELQIMTEDVSHTYSSFKAEMDKLTKVFQELRKSSEFMVQQRLNTIDEDRSIRTAAIESLRRQQKRTTKIEELASAIVAECSQYQLESKEVIDSMEVQNRDVYERHLTEIDTWASEFQGQEDIALEAVQSLHIALEEGNMSVSNKSSSITCALGETCSKASDLNEKLKKDANDFEARLTSANNSGYEDMKNIMDSIDRLCDELNNVKDEALKKREAEQNNQ